MRSRLSLVAPDLEITLAQAGLVKSKKAALAAARLATQTCNLAEVVPDPLTLESISSIDALVDALDAEYFSAQEAFENGSASVDASLVPFCRARAASSLAFAMRGEVNEAVYEAIIATDDRGRVLRIVVEALINEA